MELSLVIPAKNEEGSVQTLYREIKNALSKFSGKYEIIFIDDGSTDRTLANLTQLTKTDKRVRVIKMRGNFGKSVALQAGFDKAAGNTVITMDADLQDNPKEIIRFLNKINEGYDLVSGWKKDRHDPVTKTLPSYVVNFFVRLMTGIKIHDINCGFKAYRKSLVKTLDLYGDLYRFIPVLAHRQNFKVTELVIDHRPRMSGRSKYGWQRFFSGWLDLLTIFFLVRYQRRPGHFFGGLGVVSFLSGFIIGLYITYLRITTGSIQYRHPLLFLGMLLMIIGVQLISTGLIAELLIHTGEKRNYTNAVDTFVNF